MPLRPRYPLDDSWLFADPMSLSLIDDEEAPGWTYDALDQAQPDDGRPPVAGRVSCGNGCRRVAKPAAT